MKNQVISINQKKKDSREWNILRLFRSNYASFPIGNIEKSERPDFLLYATDKVVGIELTELKYERLDKTFNLRANEDLLSEIMTGAQLIAERKSNQKLVVDVHFNNDLKDYISKDKYDNTSLLIKTGLMETISNMVLENIPDSTGKMYVIDRYSKYGDMNLPSKIDKIYITNVTGRFKQGLWYAGISTKVKPLSVANISQRLVDKEEKLKSYNPACDECWLIIIQNSFLMSVRYNPRTADKALRHVYNSSFDRVFVFERSQGTVSELRLNKK